MGVTTMLLLTAGSLGVAGAAGLSDRAVARLRARRSAPSPVTAPQTDEWWFGDRKLAAQLFTALCDLRQQLTARDLPLPTVAVGLAAHDRLILRLADPAPTAPLPPWRPEPGEPARRSWLVDASELRQFRPGPPAYPTLVAVGRQEQWTVLVDLGHAPGPVALAGDEEQCRRFLVTLGFGLATNPWSTEVTVVAAGFPAPVSGPGPGRIRYLGSTAEALSYVERISADQRTDRVAPPTSADAPTVLLLAEPPEPGHAERLTALCQQRPGRLVVVAPGPLPQAGWTMTCTPDGRLQVPWLGLTLDPWHTTTPLSARPRPATPSALPDSWRRTIRSLPTPVLTDRERDRLWPAPVEVRMLGPLEIRAPATAPEPYRMVLTDLLVLAALHPDGAPHSLVRGLLPHPDQMSELARRVHDWLGTDEHGLPRLRPVGSAWRLSPDVRVDLRLFRALVGADPGEETAGSGAAPMADPGGPVGWPRLASALALLRGGLCAGTHLGPVAVQSLTQVGAEVQELVLRAVRQAADLADQAGNLADVEWALQQGLVFLPQVEGLWRSLLQFQSQHRPQAVPDTVVRMRAARAAGPGRIRWERATVALVKRLGHLPLLRSGPPRR